MALFVSWARHCGGCWAARRAAASEAAKALALTAPVLAADEVIA
jgi:hypothetical protein